MLKGEKLKQRNRRRSHARWLDQTPADSPLEIDVQLLENVERVLAGRHPAFIAQVTINGKNIWGQYLLIGKNKLTVNYLFEEELRKKLENTPVIIDKEGNYQRTDALLEMDDREGVSIIDPDAFIRSIKERIVQLAQDKLD